MNVFADCVGHPDLYYAIYLLFSKRLGATLYSPCGSPEWEEKGIWTGLLFGQQGALSNDVYHAPMAEFGYDFTYRGITFDKFLEMDFDVLVLTCWENEPGFEVLSEKYKPSSKFIRHMANAGEEPKICTDILSSTLDPFPECPEANRIKFRPEHLEDYCLDRIVEEKIINSFSHRLPSYPDDLGSWLEFREILGDFTWKMYGQSCYDGALPPRDMPEAIKSSMFVWHTKGMAGCGYVLRQALSSGKPCIVRKEYCFRYNALGQEYLHDGVNCIDIDPKVRTTEEAIRLIREWAEPDAYAERCQIVVDTFRKDIDFEREAADIRIWLDKVKSPKEKG